MSGLAVFLEGHTPLLQFDRLTTQVFGGGSECAVPVWAGAGLLDPETGLRPIPLPNRDVAIPDQPLLCGGLPQLAGTVRPRPRALHRTHCPRYFLTVNYLPRIRTKRLGGSEVPCRPAPSRDPYISTRDPAPRAR